jgi:hypothetical protein
MQLLDLSKTRAVSVGQHCARAKLSAFQDYYILVRQYQKVIITNIVIKTGVLNFSVAHFAFTAALHEMLSIAH